ncbi:TonB-dependent receptor [Gilvimarinus agarilyticus]|uniref:TonB-dependent receptor n=1 Tax=Gilvimarinus sp. 2_MG-2023 TaxID=3062666 RepID=UPI001C09D226|nr:TonB-dependent receptor [Gilvimarinus sp. 2_MG-2023]MBU2887112.1 TonB-dependent receptor [Gilvimarinus agarilyticus]MDO6571771.1 TonB-dependent receptor [Gilvimarinus sp. 2_MG-2023]
MYRYCPFTLSLLSVCVISAGAWAHPTMEEINVSGQRSNLIGQSVSASQGVVTQADIETRALLRVGEILELVPGMVVTQHSGTGKANQYFLRGFNLDHGTDFATVYDDMPVNMRSHGHGQGYTDINFVIPETVGSLRYQKGPYYAAVGDFSGAGATQIISLRALDEGTLKLTLGEHNYQRLLAADSLHRGNSDILWALEHTGYQGPWSDIDEDLDKLNAQLKGTTDLAAGTLRWGVMAYRNQWNSADQIPARAVTNGTINELGSIDPSAGGESNRYSVNVGFDSAHWHASAYAIDYDMNLWSNFTYYLDDPEHGDQFEQVDQRRLFGGQVTYQRVDQLVGKPMHNVFGLQTRWDDIAEVGLYTTENRVRDGVVRADSVDEHSVALYWDNTIHWRNDFKTVLGVRYDHFDFDVQDNVGVNRYGVDLSPNSGEASDGIASVKASGIYTLNPQWETYLSVGSGYHSNDARGTTIRVDPNTGSTVDSVDPLVQSLGSEWGLRGRPLQNLNVSAALWYLQLDSELLFVGDAGNTEPSDKTERTGVELTAYYRLNDNWTLDAEYAYTHARFVNEQPGRYVPGAVEDVLQLGLSADYASGLFASLRVRHFGPRPLVEIGDIKSEASTLLNAKLGYRYQAFTISVDALNLLDSDDHDIDYFYESQLAGETAPVEDVHYHPLEPRNFRLTVEVAF